MNENMNPPQGLVDRYLASGTVGQVNPFIPTARYADTEADSPFFRDEAKSSADFELLQQIKKGQAGIGYLGNDAYEFYQDRTVDQNAFGNLGAEYRIKYSAQATKGWGEQNTYGRDAWLRYMKGESSTYFWNPQNMDDPSNIHNQTSYWDAVGEGIGKWFTDYEADSEFQLMKDKIATPDASFTESIRLDKTTEFITANPNVNRVLQAGGINLYDYTRDTKNEFALRFGIHNAVIDAMQNIRLQKWDEQNQAFGSQFFDNIAYGIQDPLLVRDLVATTALTLGLGTVEVGAARLATALGQTTTAAQRAMSVANAAAKTLQLTSPFTGFVEGAAYKFLQSASLGSANTATKIALNRALAIATEAGIAGGVASYADQKKEYEWKNLLFQNRDQAFKPDWAQVGISSAAGFGTGGLMLGIMRFGLGGLGDIKYVVKGDWKGYAKNVAGSLDTWARTKDGLTVWGDRLSQGRGVLFGDLVDKYMSKAVDKRDFASILVNGTRLYATAAFSPHVTSKASFDEKAATKVATQFEAATGLPGEIVQQYPAMHPIRAMFDNLTDPEYLKRTGLSYDEASDIIRRFNERKAGLFGPTDVGGVAATGKAIAEINAENSIKALAEIFDIDQVSRRLQQQGIGFEKMNELHTRVTGKAIDFGSEADRQNYRILAKYEANGSGLAVKYLDNLRLARAGEAAADFKMPDGTVIKGEVLRDSLRLAIGLDRMIEGPDGKLVKDTTTQRLFITDAEDGEIPTFIISIEGDGTLTRHATTLKKDSQGRVYIDSEITKAADYKPENIRTVTDMNEALVKMASDVKKAVEEVKKAEADTKKAKLEKLAKTDSSVAESIKEIGKSPTRKVLKKHFNLTSEEAVMAEIVMETLGLDVTDSVLKIAEARGKRLEKLEKAGAKGSITWEQIDSGIQALIRTTKHSDFGTLVHEMGHYNRMLFIGDTEEHKAFRNKIGITDDMWDKFKEWVGYDGEWKLTDLSKEQRKAEEKFANAWAYYIRSVMSKDGKTNASGLHRLFSAMGDHLGDIGKKMESQKDLEVDLKFTDEAKAIFEKLFLRSEPQLTKLWQMAEKGVFKSLDAEARARLGESILGEELWKSYRASVNNSTIKERAKTTGIVTPKPKRVPLSERIDGIKAKITGEAFSPSKKAVKEALNAGLTDEQILARVAELRANINKLPDSPNRPAGDPMYFASHVENLSDDQLKALTEGTVLDPIPGVVRFIFDEKTKTLDVAFPVIRVSKELIEKELKRRQSRAEALKRLAEAKAKAKTATDSADAALATAEKATAPEPAKVEAAPAKPAPRTTEGDIKAGFSSMSKAISPAAAADTAKRLNKVLAGEFTFEQFASDAGIKVDGVSGTNSRLVLEEARKQGITSIADGETYLKLLEDSQTTKVEPTTAEPAKPAEAGLTPVETAKPLTVADVEPLLSKPVLPDVTSVFEEKRLADMTERFRQAGEADATDTEILQLIEQIRQERLLAESLIDQAITETQSEIPTREEFVNSVTAIVEESGGLRYIFGESAPEIEAAFISRVEEVANKLDELTPQREALDEAKIAKVEARLEENEALREIEATEIKRPEELEETTPEQAVVDLRETSDERFVDNTGKPVPELSVDEQIHATAVQQVVNDAEAVQVALVETMVAAADETVPVERIVQPIESAVPTVVNVEARVTAPINETVSSAVEVRRTLRTRTKKLKEVIPPEHHEQVEAIAEAVASGAPSAKNLLRRFLTESIEDSELADIITRFVELKARYAAADSVLVRMGILGEQQVQQYLSIPEQIRKDLINSEEMDKIIMVSLDPQIDRAIKRGKLTTSDRLAYEDAVSQLENNNRLREVIKNKLGIDEETIQKYFDYTITVQRGLIKIANEQDLETVKQYQGLVDRYRAALEKLKDGPDENLQAFVDSPATRRDVGYYNAAAERIDNRSSIGYSQVTADKREESLSRLVSEILEEEKVDQRPTVNLNEAVMSNGESLAILAGLDPTANRSVEDLGIADLFTLDVLQKKDKPTKQVNTLPFVKETRVTNPLPGKTYGLNGIRQMALILTHDFLSDGGAGFTGSKFASVLEYMEKTYDSPTKLSKRAMDVGFAKANDNPFIYNSFVALLTNNTEAVTNLFRKDLGTAYTDLKFIEGIFEINQRTKTNKIVQPIKQAPLTERRLTYMLFKNTAFLNAVGRISEKHGVAAQDVISRLYGSTKSGKGIASWFIEKLELPAESKLEDVLVAAMKWGDRETSSKKLNSSINLIAERLSLDAKRKSRGKATISGDDDLGGAEGAGVFLGVSEDYRNRKIDSSASSFIQTIQSLFYEYIRETKIGNDPISLGDYFVARLKAAEEAQDNQIKLTVEKIKEITGFDLSRDMADRREKNITKQLESFFEDLLASEEIDTDTKKLVLAFKDQRLGLGVKKGATGELNQAKLEEDVAIELRSVVYSDESPSLRTVLEVLGSSDSEYAALAREMIDISNRDLADIGIYPVRSKINAAAYYDPNLSSVLFNDAKTRNFRAQIVLHEALHAVSHKYIVGIEERAMTDLNKQYTGQSYIDALRVYAETQKKSKEYSAEAELIEAYIEAIDSGEFKLEIDAVGTEDDMKIGTYGLLNLHEFVSEAMTNKEFATKLASIQSKTKANRSLLKSLYNAILQLTGLNKLKNVSLLEKVSMATETIAKTDTFNEFEIETNFLRQTLGVSALDEKTGKQIVKAVEADRKTMDMLIKTLNDMSASKGRLKKGFEEDDEMFQADLIDAVDLRRRKLAEYGLHEELTEEDLVQIQRILNGLSPVDMETDKIFSNIKSEFKVSSITTPKKDYIGSNYRDLTTEQRRDFVANTLIPKIKEAMGNRNNSAGLYSAASNSTFGKKINALIGGAANYGDTADSNSIFLQFISKIFDPMMDMRDGELKNQFNIPSIDKLNAEVNNILLRSNLIQTQNKILAKVKKPADLQDLMNTAWLYLTRPADLPDVPNKDLILELIKARNEFNKITVELLSNFGSLSKKTDPNQYGTSHIASHYAKQNQKEFADALTAHAVKKTVEEGKISVITAEALGWLTIKRDAATDEIVSVKIDESSPLAKLLEENKVGKKLAWKSDVKKIFDDVTALDAATQDIHRKALTTNEDYVESWKQAYASKGPEFTAIRQSMEIARNRYLGIDFADSKSGSPRRIAIGEGRNYTEERIISHDEIARDPQLSRFFSSDILDLSHSELRGSVTDAVMTKYISEFFGTRMSMSDLLQVLASNAEEFQGRSHLSAKEIESRQRGYERLRNAWNHSVGNWMSAYDSVDENYKALLDSSRQLTVLASGLRASLMSVPETGRAVLTSNKNKGMVMQLLPNLVKLAKLVGPGGKNRRLARQQMISASHWLRGLSTDHMLHRNGIHPENPFQGVVFGQGAGGMFGNFVNAWRTAGVKNATETSSLRRVLNRTAAFAAAAEAPLAFVNDCTTTLHIWNAQENLTKNYDAFRKLADFLEKKPAADYSEFASLAKRCGLAPKEALDLSLAGLLKTKAIDALTQAAKDKTLYTDGILDVRKLYIWAGEDADKIDAINTMGGYINMTARHTNVEPTLLDIRVNQSVFGKAMSHYMQFLLSMGVQEIGRRRRTQSLGYSQHLAGLIIMEITAYGTARALSDPGDEEKGGYDEFVNNPMDYMVRTATSIPLLGSYQFLGNITRHAIMGVSDYMGGPGTEDKFRVPDLFSSPSSTSPRRLLNTPEVVKSWYNEGHEILTELLAD